MTTVYLCAVASYSPANGANELKRILLLDEDDLIYACKNNEFDVVSHFFVRLYTSGVNNHVKIPISVGKLNLDNEEIEQLKNDTVVYSVTEDFLPEEN